MSPISRKKKTRSHNEHFRRTKSATRNRFKSFYLLSCRVLRTRVSTINIFLVVLKLVPVAHCVHAAKMFEARTRNRAQFSKGHRNKFRLPTRCRRRVIYGSAAGKTLNDNGTKQPLRFYRRFANIRCRCRGQDFFSGGGGFSS